MFALRDYQQAAVDAVRESFRLGRRRPLMVSPTGSGKTVVFSYITASAAAKGNRTLILVHRQELVKQAHESLASMDVPHGLIAAGRTADPTQVTQIASVQTLVRRLDCIKPPDLIVIDEAHHATAGAWSKVLTAFPQARVLGVTATPERLDGKGLGVVFDELIRGPEVSNLIGRGFLCKPVYYAPKTVDMSGVKITAGDYNRAEMSARVNRPKITGDAVDHYRNYADGLPCVVFCTGLDHAANVCEAFNRAGYRFAVLDGTLSPEMRARRVLSLGNGDLQGLVTVDIVSEGFDLPIVACAILLRPTASLALHLQQIGRTLRVAPNKPRAVILDAVGNCKRHGLAEEFRDWSLEGAKKRRSSGPQEIDTVRTCPMCFAVHTPSPNCPQCLHVYFVASRTPDQVDGELEELQARQDRRYEQGTAQTHGDLVRVGKARGMKNPWGWASNVLRARLRK